MKPINIIFIREYNPAICKKLVQKLIEAYDKVGLNSSKRSDSSKNSDRSK